MKTCMNFPNYYSVVMLNLLDECDNSVISTSTFVVRLRGIGITFPVAFFLFFQFLNYDLSKVCKAIWAITYI